MRPRPSEKALDIFTASISLSTQLGGGGISGHMTPKSSQTEEVIENLEGNCFSHFWTKPQITLNNSQKSFWPLLTKCGYYEENCGCFNPLLTLLPYTYPHLKHF